MRFVMPVLAAGAAVVSAPASAAAFFDYSGTVTQVSDLRFSPGQQVTARVRVGEQGPDFQQADVGVTLIIGSQQFDLFGSGPAGEGAFGVGRGQPGQATQFVSVNVPGVSLRIDEFSNNLTGGPFFLGTLTTVDGRVDFTGAVTPAIPEPSTWAMMIVGFGIAGVGLRKGRLTAPERGVA